MTINLSPQYWSAVAALPSTEVNCGVGGVRLFTESEIKEGQLGYSVHADRFSLVGDDPGSWQAEWVVIGYETSLGDPIFCDGAAERFPVFTAMHGEGEWTPAFVAPSLECFLECFRLFAKFARKRGNPVELEANPPSEHEIGEYRQELLRLTGEDEDGVFFWMLNAQIDVE